MKKNQELLSKIVREELSVKFWQIDKIEFSNNAKRGVSIKGFYSPIYKGQTYCIYSHRKISQLIQVEK